MGTFTWDSETALPGEWTSETDASGLLSRSTDAAAVHEGLQGTQYVGDGTATIAYLRKDSLVIENSSITVTAWVKPAAGLTIGVNTFDGFCFLEGHDTGVRWRLFVRQDRKWNFHHHTATGFNANYNNLGTAVANDTWHKVVLVCTNIGTTSGTASLSVNDTEILSQTGLDFSTWSATAHQLRIGAPYTLNTITGTSYFDDGSYVSEVGATAVSDSVQTRWAVDAPIADVVQARWATNTGQVARPSADLLVGDGWQTNTGATTGLHATMDETTPDAADYARCPASPDGTKVYIQEFSDAIGDPGGPAGVLPGYAYFKGVDSGAPQIDYELRVYDADEWVSDASPGTLIATRTHTNISTTPTVVDSVELTQGEYDAVTWPLTPVYRHKFTQV